MRRRRVDDRDTTDMPGQDSFLDIIANIVGILILLVMIVGVRAAMLGRESAGRVDVQPPPPVVTDDELDTARRELAAESVHLRESQARNALLRRDNSIRQQERDALATYVADFEQQIAERRSRLDNESQRDFDLRRQLVEAQQELDDLSRQQISLLSEVPQRKELRNMPTPIGRTVTENEIHVRVKYGNVSIVPMDKLLERFERLHTQNFATAVRSNGGAFAVGPIRGYRMHVQAGARRRQLPTGGHVAEARVYAEFIPTDAEIGESIEESIEDSSMLISELRRNNPRRTVVTLWVFPDSYDSLHPLRDKIQDLGFSTAMRVQAQHTEVAGGTDGTRSVAQ